MFLPPLPRLLVFLQIPGGLPFCLVSVLGFFSGVVLLVTASFLHVLLFLRDVFVRERIWAPQAWPWVSLSVPLSTLVFSFLFSLLIVHCGFR